ncbi:phage holin family protein [Planosporangium sp. 12N6]|uniref:phage holin family protein n=1 Tax=Planosporangium spinosum TaxID=3402278 RepID=UPI003CE80709
MVRTASEQLSRLVRDEVRVGRLELAAKARGFGVGVGLFGAAGVVALYGVAALLATLVLVLALVMPAWLAALAVTVGLFTVATVMALIGRGRLRRAGPPVPEQTLASLKADIRTISNAVRERRKP